MNELLSEIDRNESEMYGRCTWREGNVRSSTANESKTVRGEKAGVKGVLQALHHYLHVGD